MSGRRISALVGLAIALAFALATAAASGGDVGAGALTPADVCADPDDCRFRETDRIAGVGVGFAVGNLSQEHHAARSSYAIEPRTRLF